MSQYVIRDNPEIIFIDISEIYRTIISKLSAINYLHQYYNLSEPNENFLVQNSLLGVRHLGTLPDSRMPISFLFLH